jgi:hypothetical protein
MRATINFEVDVEKVDSIMRHLVSVQAQELIDTLQELNLNSDSNLLINLTETLKTVSDQARQLYQYREMISSFEASRITPYLPSDEESRATEDVLGETSQLVHNSQELREAMSTADQFGSFLEKLNEFAEPPVPGGDDGVESKKG